MVPRCLQLERATLEQYGMPVITGGGSSTPRVENLADLGRRYP